MRALSSLEYWSLHINQDHLSKFALFFLYFLIFNSFCFDFWFNFKYFHGIYHFLIIYLALQLLILPLNFFYSLNQSLNSLFLFTFLLLIYFLDVMQLFNYYLAIFRVQNDLRQLILIYFAKLFKKINSCLIEIKRVFLADFICKIALKG